MFGKLLNTNFLLRSTRARSGVVGVANGRTVQVPGSGSTRRLPVNRQIVLSDKEKLAAMHTVRY